MTPLFGLPFALGRKSEEEDPFASARQKWFRQTALVAVLIWLPFVLFALFAGQDRLIRFFPDDAFYYLQPAFNFAHRGVVSFDGVHPTNGFHPLNFLLIAMLALAVPKASLLSGTFIMHSGFLVAGVWLLTVHYLQRFPGQIAAMAVAVSTLPVFTLILLLSMGLEASLVLFCTALLILAWDRARERWFQSVTCNILLGLTIGLLVLTRLDLGLVLLPFFGFILGLAYYGNASVRLPRPLWPLSPIWLAPLLLLCGYALCNLAAMGNPLPVSLYVKFVSFFLADSANFFFNVPLWAPSTQNSIAGWVVVLMPLMASILLLPVQARSKDPKGWIGSAAFLLNVGNLLFYAYLAVAVRLVFRWYFAFPAACTLLNLAWFLRWLDHRVARRLDRRSSWLPAWLIVAFSIVANLIFLVWIGNRPESVSYNLKKVSELVNRFGGASAVTATSDSGIVGFYADGRVINLDGLSNDFEYVRDFLWTQQLRAYFRREGVTHFLVRDGLLTNRDTVVSGRYAEASTFLDSSLVLSSQDELFRYEIPGQFRLIYFRLPPPAGSERPPR